MPKSKSNGTSFKKGRKKTGGRKAGTPNKTTMLLREAVLAGAEAAGNELGGDGHVSYMKFVALNHPKSFLPLYASSMPQQLEPEPPEGKVFHTVEDVREHLREFGIEPEAFAQALLGPPPFVPAEVSAGGGPRVEDDASDSSIRGGEV